VYYTSVWGWSQEKRSETVAAIVGRTIGRLPRSSIVAVIVVVGVGHVGFVTPVFPLLLHGLLPRGVEVVGEVGGAVEVSVVAVHAPIIPDPAPRSRTTFKKSACVSPWGNTGYSRRRRPRLPLWQNFLVAEPNICIMIRIPDQGQLTSEVIGSPRVITLLHVFHGSLFGTFPGGKDAHKSIAFVSHLHGESVHFIHSESPQFGELSLAMCSPFVHVHVLFPLPFVDSFLGSISILKEEIDAILRNGKVREFVAEVDVVLAHI